MYRVDKWKSAAAVLLLTMVTAALSLSTVAADQVKLNVGLGHPMLLADKKQMTYLKVGLTGFEMEDAERRTPVNVAIVLDKSGSMGSGGKIEKAKEAAIMALRRLDGNDVVSVITYDHTVNVLVPATKLSDWESVSAAIRKITAGGNTALFAGVSKGADEVRKFSDENRANRIILLSDGLANVGPKSPAELGSLGASLIKEGIAVTTIGLGGGYNEDLMTQLAQKSDGNHYFAENGTDLARIYNAEFGDVLSVVAQKVLVKIHCAKGIRPVRVLGRQADITGQLVVARLNQLYSNQEKYVMLEVEIPATAKGRTRQIAVVDVSYANMETRTTDRLKSTIEARFTKSPQMVERSINPDVMVPAIELIATVNNKLALALRDQGKIEEARKVLVSNGTFLDSNGDRFNSERLRAYGRANYDDAENLKEDNWKEQRKRMRGWQHYNEYQQKSH